jgi:ribonuclease HI
MHTITHDLLRALKTGPGGYTRVTLKALGVKWPPTNGWTRTIVGQSITNEQYEQALAGRTAKKKKKKGKAAAEPAASPVIPDAKSVEAWTDGGCWKNPGGAGAWAAVLKYGEHRREISGKVEAPTTNNICELLAVIHAAEAMKVPVKLTIHADSEYVIQAARGAKAKANKDLVARMRTALARHIVEFKWCQGHSGNAENERCDELCNAHRIEAEADAGT